MVLLQGALTFKWTEKWHSGQSLILHGALSKKHSNTQASTQDTKRTHIPHIITQRAHRGDIDGSPWLLKSTSFLFHFPQRQSYVTKVLGVTHGGMNNQIVSGGWLLLTESVGGAPQASRDAIFTISNIRTTVIAACHGASMWARGHVEAFLHLECTLCIMTQCTSAVEKYVCVLISIKIAEHAH